MTFYSVGCAISKLHIKKGDKIRFIPLMAGADIKIGNDGVAPSVLFEPTSMFYPLCFPIQCTYDGLGGVKNVKKNAHTTALRKYFGVKVEDICKIANCERNLKNSYSALHQLLEERTFSPEILQRLNMLKGLSGMFILESVYQLMINNSELNKVKVPLIEGYYQEILDLGDTYFKKLAELDSKNLPDTPEAAEIYDSIKFSLNPLYKGNGYTALIPVEKWIYFRDIFGESLMKGELKDELIAQWCIYYTMQQVNLVYEPSHSSYSQVSFQSSVRFLEGLLDIAKPLAAKEK